MPVHPTQRVLDSARIANFYHDLFVKSQVEDFAEICAPKLLDKTLVSDMGGGCGYFASAVARSLGLPVRVVDSDPRSVEAAERVGLQAYVGDALTWDPKGDKGVASFNLILHHLVGRDEATTTKLQMAALERWKGTRVRLFVNEYIYDSWIADLSGRIIYQVTSSRFLSAIARFISQVAPSLRANTFGVGVRFRSQSEWRRLFEANGWQIVSLKRGPDERISLARRALLIKSCRRDSFVLADSNWAQVRN